MSIDPDALNADCNANAALDYIPHALSSLRTFFIAHGTPVSGFARGRVEMGMNRLGMCTASPRVFAGGVFRRAGKAFSPSLYIGVMYADHVRSPHIYIPAL